MYLEFNTPPQLPEHSRSLSSTSTFVHEAIDAATSATISERRATERARDSAEDVRKLSGFTVSMLCDSFGDTQHKNWARKAFRWCFVCRMSLNLKSNKLNDAKQYCCAQ